MIVNDNSKKVLDELNLLIYFFLSGLPDADYLFSLFVFEHDRPHLLVSGIHYLHLHLAIASLFCDVALFEVGC